MTKERKPSGIQPAYSEKHDAWYDAARNLWLEKKCDDPDCVFCRDRPDTPEEIDKLILTKEDAALIKHWRIDKGCSWRRVAELADDHWPNRGILREDQIEGRELCNEARKILDENNNDAWN